MTMQSLKDSLLANECDRSKGGCGAKPGEPCYITNPYFDGWPHAVRYSNGM